MADWLSAHKVLSVGIVDGRNIWRTDPDAALATLRPVVDKNRGELWIAPSCSLLHVPFSLAAENKLDAEFEVVARLCGRKARRTVACCVPCSTAAKAPSLRSSRPRAPQWPRGAAARACTAPTWRCGWHAAWRATTSAPRTFTQAPVGAARALCVPRAADHHHRLVPADHGDPRRARRIQAGRPRCGEATARRCAPRSRWPCASRRHWVSTCWCTARPSATTWSSTSANSSTALRLPPTAGCSRTARAA